jgi:SulP family sulfate permease
MRKIRFNYSWRLFLGDAFGGLIAALIALPYGLAMATLMGLPPVLGLFTSIITSPITAILGRNPVLIGGTASPTIPIISQAVKMQGLGGAAKVSIVAAVFMMVFSFLRLGRFIQKVPQPVVTGFSCGIGGLMVVLQLESMLGLPAAHTEGAPINSLFSVLSRLNMTRWQPLLLGAIVIVISQLISMRSKKLPAPLMAVGIAILASNLLGLHEKEVGRLPLEIPEFARFEWTPAEIGDVLWSGLGLGFVVSIYVLLTSRVVDHFRGKHFHGKRADADAELGAYGIANICAGIFGAPASVGIPARSLANVRCGGTTFMSNIFHAAILALLVALGADFVAHIPIPALGGVTAWMGICLLDWSTWRRLPKMRRLDAVGFFVTSIGVMVMNSVLAVALGCLVYVAHWLWLKVKAPQAAEAPAEQVPQL